MAAEQHEIKVPEDFVPVRVDAFISQQLEGVSRSQIDLESTVIKLNGKVCKKSRKVSPGDLVSIEIVRETPEHIEPEHVEFPILFENTHVIVIDKPQSLVVHPAAGNWHGTLVHGLLYRYRDLGTLDETRPGIVHRLDKDTSGVMIVAKDTKTLEALSAQFSGRSTRKVYIAIVKGTVQKRRGIIKTQIVRDRRDRKKFTVSDNPDEGKFAETHYLVLRQFMGAALVRLTLKTGRTHQLRVHMKHIGHPIIGDPIYSRPDKHLKDATLMLHALSLTIAIPDDSGDMEEQKFTAPMPDRFRAALRSLQPSAPASHVSGLH